MTPCGADGFSNTSKNPCCRDNEALLFDGAGNDGHVFLAGDAEIPDSLDVRL
jgi:hypothetical protein